MDIQKPVIGNVIARTVNGTITVPGYMRNELWSSIKTVETEQKR